MEAAFQSRKKCDELVQRLKQANKYQAFVKEFSACKSQADYVACLLTLPEMEGLFIVQEKFKLKDKREAEICRAEGNKYFKLKNYEKALQYYTLSILKAPNDSDNLSLAYNNRSLTNFYSKQYVLCLQDIELAFLHNYPKKSCYKLYQRLGRCMYALGHKQEAIKAFQQTIITLECADINNETKQEMVEDMRRAISQSSAMVERNPANISVKTVNHCHKNIPEMPASASKEIPCLSEALELRLDAFGGRGLYATRDIQIGEVLIKERPFTSVLLRENNLTHCQLCCNRLLLPIPCHQCSGIAYCSLECQNLAWEKFHWAECKILGNIQDSKGDLGLLATRMILNADFDILINMQMKEEVERLKGFSEDGQYHSNSYIACYSLVHHQEKRTFMDMLTRTVSAVFFLKHLEFVGFFTPSIRKSMVDKVKSPSLNWDNLSVCQNENNDNKDLTTVMETKVISDSNMFKHKTIVGGHILRNIMMLPCNAHEVSELELNVENPAMSATKELAAAIYPVLSLVNHSCDPSIVRHSFGNLCIARSIRSIKAGEEIRDNYGALYPTMDLPTRQDHLSCQYYFKCSCEACQSNWPLYFDIPCDNLILKCIKCNGNVTVTGQNLPGESTNEAKCNCCGVSQNISNRLLKLGQLESSYRSTLMSVIDGDNSDENFKCLLRYLQLSESMIQRPWRDINDCQEALKQCLSMQANCFPFS